MAEAAELIRRLPDGDAFIRDFLDGRRARTPTGRRTSARARARGRPRRCSTRPTTTRSRSRSRDDEEAFRRLAEASDEPAVTREIDGWWAVGASEAALDRYEAALDDGSLEDSDAFRDATAELPDDRLVTVYARPTSGASAGPIPGMLDEQALECLSGGDPNRPTAFAVTVADGGFRLDASATPTAVRRRVGRVGSRRQASCRRPRATRAAGTGRPSSGRCSTAPGSRSGAQLGQLELFTGISVEDDLLAALPRRDGVRALPLRHRRLLRPDRDRRHRGRGRGGDPRAARPAHRGAGAVLREPPHRACSASADSRSERSGRAIPSSPTPRRTACSLVSNKPEGVRLLARSGPKLAADPRYLDAREAAGIPDETAGFLYVDVAGITSWTRTQAEPRALGGLLVWGEQDGDEISTQGFLAID